MIKTLDELTAEFTEKFGGDKSDAFIEFLENMSDTISDLVSKNTDIDERLRKLDNDWRERYIKRFTNVDVVEPNKNYEDIEEEESKNEESEKTIDDLFEE